MMDWVESKSVWFFLPEFADELVGGTALKSFESSGEVVGVDEVPEMGLKPIVAVVVESTTARLSHSDAQKGTLDKICEILRGHFRMLFHKSRDV
jgi:hypothetical protein